MTLAMMIALNRSVEFERHVRAALEGGVSSDLIKEVILQSAIHCGVPGADTAFHAAAEVMAALTPPEDAR